MRRMKLAVFLALFLAMGLGGCARANGESEAAQPFPVAAVNLEQNATDEDVEVVLKVKGGDEGLKQLSVTAPDGRTVVEFSSPSSPTLGMRLFRFESPEPLDTRSLLAAFPAGVYTFRGVTVGGATLEGAANLTHGLPPASDFVHPEPDGEVTPKADLRVRWKAVPGVAGYVLKIEQEETAVGMTVRLPATSTSFTVPKSLLAPGVEYQLGIGTLTREGNATFVEMTFDTTDE